MTIKKGLKVASQILHAMNPTSIRLKDDFQSLLYALKRVCLHFCFDVCKVAQSLAFCNT